MLIDRTAEFEKAWAIYMASHRVFPPAEAMFYAGWEAGRAYGLKLVESKCPAMDEGVD